MELNFEFGKPTSVRNRYREFAVLGLIFVAACLPYFALFWFNQVIAGSVIVFAAVFKVLATFITSIKTDTAHHVRFLLSGSNPIGMTGGSSMLLGGVDALLDWNDDRAVRRKYPLRFAIVTLVKFLLTPIGLLLMFLEFAWDILLLRRGLRMVKHKWNEFFSLAQYHDIICAEKSNDIFYADMAYARYRDDPYHYQWVRMRSMVFELQHYKLDVDDGIGNPKTNLFLQDEMSAYINLKNLQIEEIESALDAHYRECPESFLFPPKLSMKLIRNARPVQHYLRIRDELRPKLKARMTKFDADLHSLVDAINLTLRQTTTSEGSALFSISSWQLLRLLDDEQSYNSEYLPPELIRSLRDAGIVDRETGSAASPFPLALEQRFSEFLATHFVLAPAEKRREVSAFVIRRDGELYVPANLT
jgi:hypothetical protein